MKGHGAKLPRKQHQAIAALMSCRTLREAAETVGVGEATIFRWLQDKHFQNAYRKAKHQVVQQALSNLQQVSGQAVDALRKIMLDPKKPPSTRVTAARVILESAIKALEVDNLEARIEALEDKVNRAKR